MEGAFEEENLGGTENALGGLARLCYSQMDGTLLTEDDFAGVLSKMPFSTDEAEPSHARFLEQVANPNSIVHSEKIKPLA